MGQLHSMMPNYNLKNIEKSFKNPAVHQGSQLIMSRIFIFFGLLVSINVLSQKKTKIPVLYSGTDLLKEISSIDGLIFGREVGNLIEYSQITFHVKANGLVDSVEVRSSLSAWADSVNTKKVKDLF